MWALVAGQRWGVQHEKGVGSRVNVEREEGGPEGRLEGGGVAVFPLSAVKTFSS